MSRGKKRLEALASEDDPTLPMVAICGRPNVGKSTLFNRLVGGNKAIVDETAGVTRDRRYGICTWGRVRFRLCDTGGLDPGAKGGVIQEGIHRQAARAMEEAALVLFVVDAQVGVAPDDQTIARQLKRTGRPVLWVANKVDSAKHEASATELYRLGAEEVFSVSGGHGRGIGDLLDAVVAKLGGEEALTRDNAPSDEDVLPGLADHSDDESNEGDDVAGLEVDSSEAKAAENAPIRLALIGKPNVGKSSLVNRLLGEERVLVHDMPGTTVDPIDTAATIAGREFLLIDTAGIRRRRSIDRDDAVEVVSVTRSIGTAERSDVVALVIDATEGITEQDQKIASLIERAARGVIIVFNKVDLLGTGAEREAALKNLREEVEDKLAFIQHAPTLFLSAQTGERVLAIAEIAASVYREFSRRIPTSELNRFFADVQAKRQPPSAKGNPVKIHYITQTEVRPPLFVVSVNRPEWVHFTYRRFLQNQIREIFGFAGSPVRLVCRGKGGRHRHGTPRVAR